MITYDVFARLWPNASKELIDALVDQIPKSSLRIPGELAQFMAQISHESMGGSVLTENLNYTSASRIAAVWPTRFNAATALAYVRRPQALANKVYNGRMGNRVGSDDGWTFRGRGLKGITGREMYEKYGVAHDPDSVSDPANAFSIALKIWNDKGCAEPARRGDIEAVTRKINGGLIGLSDRRIWLQKWTRALSNIPTTGLGSTGEMVKSAQERLRALSYNVGSPDGSYGPLTRAAVLAFQADNDLPTSGELTSQTIQRLMSAPPRAERAPVEASQLREKGSETIRLADGVKAVGAGTVGTLGLLETAKQWSTQMTEVKDIFEKFQPISDWISSNIWVLAVGAGVVLYYFADRIIKNRVLDHNSGRNIGR